MLESREKKEIKAFFTGSSKDEENPILKLDSIVFNERNVEIVGNDK